MTPKQQIDQFRKLVNQYIPGAAVAVDPPSNPTGDWFIDVTYRDHRLVVEFRPSLGFGISSGSEDSYGEGPDEFFQTPEAAAHRVEHLVQAGERTVPQRVRLLQELREERQISQVDLAARLGIRQPTVSKIERREDVALSTLRRYIEALGGRLRVTAQFADGRFEIDLDDKVSGGHR